MSLSLVDGLSAVWPGTATTVANVPLRMATVERLAPGSGRARRARAFFSHRMRSPTAKLLARGQADLLPQLARLAPALPRQVVQGGHVGAGDGQDGRGGLGVDAPPPVDQLVTGVGDVSGHGDPVVGVVGGDRRGDVTLSELDEGLALPLLVDLGLAAVGGQLDDMGGQGVGQRRRAPPASMDES